MQGVEPGDPEGPDNYWEESVPLECIYLFLCYCLHLFWGCPWCRGLGGGWLTVLPDHLFKEDDQDSESEKLVVKEPEPDDAADEKFSFKYSPGKLRGNQYKSMMTKEELEEEQRVQRKQLAAIFRLMKEKSDTFGEMSEGDMKEQLRLYDI
ncbi:PREDICTED: matrix-remodeling-associated protein 7 [Gavialis gangeticus]|uniref:matrix-remodeling-associated protein 7 n=1 Tax=Gavialis gangeticus TaxID=94835 RepID=UPI00092F0530|nr:PREDICTED: matrix-remodeling-associated protein 7 [Gavialis gangeticus]